MFASIVIGWAAEVTAVHLSVGIALAVLAWLQCAPEFAVEASIAWARDSHLALANLTGSLRLLLGFGWPVVFLIHWVTQRRRGKSPKEIILPESFAVEAAGLGLPVLYFVYIYFKAAWSFWDGLVLCGFYGFYFWMLNRKRRVGISSSEVFEDEDEEPWVVRKVLKSSKSTQRLAAFGMFSFGAAVLWITVPPFVEALKSAAFALGVSEFVFIQWLAPLASEFPEKVTAFNWARRPRKVSMAIVNMLSSVTSQWTLLAGLVPIVFSISARTPFTIQLSPFQRSEILLTITQSALAVVFLSDLKIKNYEALGLFILWAIQFFVPSLRGIIVFVYFAWLFFECVKIAANPKRAVVWRILKRCLR